MVDIKCTFNMTTASVTSHWTMKHVIVFVVLFTVLEACMVYESGVKDVDRDFILKEHNDLRKRVANGLVPGQPRGINLKRLKWDPTLADIAQKHADKCILQPDNIEDDRWPVGQSLFSQYSSAYNKPTAWKTPLKAWFDEYKRYRFSEGFIPAAGHYSQAVWADTEYIGCGYIFYKEYKNDYWYRKLYVCNYGPAGNYLGERPYEVGTQGCEDLC